MILPFFVTFLIRTLAWKTILADDGWVVSALNSIGLLPRTAGAVDELGGDRRPDLQLDHLHDPAAVRQPEKIDARLLEASRDLTPPTAGCSGR